MSRVESALAPPRRVEHPGAERDPRAVRHGSRAVLATLTAAQREAAACFVERARPWLDFGLNDGDSMSADGVACVLGIVADGLRLQGVTHGRAQLGRGQGGQTPGRLGRGPGVGTC